MVYIQYYQTGVAHKWNDHTADLIEVCGDRGVVQLDGRNSLETMHNDATEFNGHHRPIYMKLTDYLGVTRTVGAILSVI